MIGRSVKEPVCCAQGLGDMARVEIRFEAGFRKGLS